MATAVDGRKVVKNVTTMVAMGDLGAAGLGSVSLYGTITAANAARAAASQVTPATTPDISGHSSTDSGSQSGSPSGSGTQLLPGSGGASHSRSAGS